MSDVLVLSRDWEPYERIPWQEAFTRLFGGTGKNKVEVIEYADRVVTSGADDSGALREWKVPSVIRFIHATTPEIKRVKFSRENVYARDRGTCQYCGRKVAVSEFEYEHVIPRRKPYNGPTTWENIVVSCTACNQKKGGRTPAEAGMTLLSTPRRPGKGFRKRKMEIVWQRGMPESWKSYMRDVTYWKGELDNDNE